MARPIHDSDRWCTLNERISRAACAFIFFEEFKVSRSFSSCVYVCANCEQLVPFGINDVCMKSSLKWCDVVWNNKSLSLLRKEEFLEKCRQFSRDATYSIRSAGVRVVRNFAYLPVKYRNRSYKLQSCPKQDFISSIAPPTTNCMRHPGSIRPNSKEEMNRKNGIIPRPSFSVHFASGNYPRGRGRKKKCTIHFAMAHSSISSNPLSAGFAVS